MPRVTDPPRDSWGFGGAPGGPSGAGTRYYDTPAQPVYRAAVQMPVSKVESSSSSALFLHFILTIVVYFIDWLAFFQVNDIH